MHRCVEDASKRWTHATQSPEVCAARGAVPRTPSNGFGATPHTLPSRARLVDARVEVFVMTKTLLATLPHLAEHLLFDGYVLPAQKQEKQEMGSMFLVHMILLCIILMGGKA